MSTKALQEQLVQIARRWQKIEDAAVASTSKVLEKTDNPLVRLVMDMILRDSRFHRRVQQVLIDSLQTEAITISPDDLADVWSLIENHIELEKQTVDLANEALEPIRGKRSNVVQQYLLEYLLADEQKHTRALENLSAIKSNMYPYGG